MGKRVWTKKLVITRKSILKKNAMKQQSTTENNSNNNNNNNISNSNEIIRHNISKMNQQKQKTNEIKNNAKKFNKNKNKNKKKHNNNSNNHNNDKNMNSTNKTNNNNNNKQKTQKSGNSHRQMGNPDNRTLIIYDLPSYANIYNIEERFQFAGNVEIIFPHELLSSNENDQTNVKVAKELQRQKMVIEQTQQQIQEQKMKEKNKNKRNNKNRHNNKNNDKNNNKNKKEENKNSDDIDMNVVNDSKNDISKAVRLNPNLPKNTDNNTVDILYATRDYNIYSRFAYLIFETKHICSLALKRYNNKRLIAMKFDENNKPINRKQNDKVKLLSSKAYNISLKNESNCVSIINVNKDCKSRDEIRTFLSNVAIPIKVKKTTNRGVWIAKFETPIQATLAVQILSGRRLNGTPVFLNWEKDIDAKKLNEKIAKKVSESMKNTHQLGGLFAKDYDIKQENKKKKLQNKLKAEKMKNSKFQGKNFGVNFHLNEIDSLVNGIDYDGQNMKGAEDIFSKIRGF